MSNKDKNVLALCTCGSGKDYNECCGRFIETLELPTETPEHILRSRYTSYNRSKGEYLLKSWHQSFRPKKNAKQIVREGANIKYTGLKVLNVEFDDTKGKISYEVRSRDGMRFGSYATTSNFIKEEGYWYYTNDDSDV